MSLLERKAKEYKAVLRQRKTEELLSMGTNLKAKIKAEKVKEVPDRASIENYRWQLNLINNELNKRRKPQERLEEIKQDIPVPKSYAETLTERTLDELHKLESELKAETEKMKSMEQTEDVKNKITGMMANMNALTSEINSRDKKVADEVKKDIAKAEGKVMGVDTDLIISGAIGAILGGTVGWALGKNVIAGAFIGLASGSGMTFLIKKGNVVVAKP